MELRDRLFELEKQSWQASVARDGDFYRSHLTDDALSIVALPEAFPAGPFDKNLMVEGIESLVEPISPSYLLADPVVVELSATSAVLTYKATARIKGAEHPYSVLIGSVYVQRDGKWQMAYHQQTPTALLHDDLS